MKQILLALAILISFGSKAQTIPAHIDTATRQWYANIDPIPISDSLDLSQVRITFNGGVPFWYGNIHVSMCYLESGSGRYVEFQGWNFQVNYSATITNPVQAVFAWVRDSMTVNGRQIYTIVYVP